jgi:hypothetical protein
MSGVFLNNLYLFIWLQEQVAVVLSGYTATLNPSDRAILHFLQLCEENSVDLTEFKPILFGKEAVRQYTAKVGEGDCTERCYLLCD